MLNQFSELGNAIGSSHGTSNAEMQKQAYSAPASPPGVVEMTGIAHEAFEVLSQRLNELILKISPLIEPYPVPPPADGNQQGKSCEASAVAGLRILVVRIQGKSEDIQQVTDALRV